MRTIATRKLLYYCNMNIWLHVKLFNLISVRSTYEESSITF